MALSNPNCRVFFFCFMVHHYNLIIGLKISLISEIKAKEDLTDSSALSLTGSYITDLHVQPAHYFCGQKLKDGRGCYIAKITVFLNT